MSSLHNEIETALGHIFASSYLAMALKIDSQDSHALQVIGTQLLNFVVTDMLYDAGETSLEDSLQILLSTRFLLLAASSSRIQTGHGDINAEDVEKAFLAVVGALYKDAGFDTTVGFIKEIWQHFLRDLNKMKSKSISKSDSISNLSSKPVTPKLKSRDSTPSDVEMQVDPADNPKNKLLEFCQKNKVAPPTFTLLAKEGPSHAPKFHVQCTIWNGVTTSGSGISRKEAEKAAARAMLESLS